MITTAFYDPAAGETKRHDFKAIVVGSMLNGVYYVRYAYVKQETSANDVVEELYRLDAAYPGIIQGFEKNGFQVLYKELLANKAEKKGYPISVAGITSVSNKYSRIESLGGFVEDGSIQFAKDVDGYTSDIGILAEQLLDFPNAAHDDGPDALYYAFNMARDKAMRAAYGSRRKAQSTKHKAQGRRHKTEGAKHKAQNTRNE